MASPMMALLADPQRSNMIKQGAEARVYICELLPTCRMTTLDGQADAECSTSTRTSATACLLKYRFPKKYRHHSLSTNLTASRTTAEARALVRCARAGVNTPGILCVDEIEGILGLEVIDGKSIRELLGGGSEGDELPFEEVLEQTDVKVEVIAQTSEESELLDDQSAMQVMHLIGEQLARMHQVHVIHGDLTTSNMMLRTSRKGQPEVVLIDFGLSTNSTLAEDKAVDLYVLERAFQSTHPCSEHLYAAIMNAYRTTLEESSDADLAVPIKEKKKGVKGIIPGPTVWKEISRRLEDVRLRGRKRSMLG